MRKPLIDPVVVGSGKPLFQEGLAKTPLEVVRSTTFGSGVHHVIHAPRSA
ncbi:hypothetical protein ACFYXH_34055 [Streptomyces sp. NPDC002730]